MPTVSLKLRQQIRSEEKLLMKKSEIHLYFNLGKEILKKPFLKIRKTHFINGFRNHSKILHPFTYINIFCM